MATLAGLILGPHCLDWFNPLSWGNSDHITLEICRIVLCIQIVAVAVELPRKYMKKHWVSVTILLFPVMTCGWLIVGLFIWILIPHFNFPSSLLVSACVTATDPVLAAAVVGKGKFAERVPGHLRNLLTAESGCNDGMAFPFIYLSLNLITHSGNAREIVKEWFTLTILWECLFGVVLGVFLGYTLRKAVAFAEKKGLIDRESFLALFVFLAFNSAGIGSMLGVDDLLVSFAAGTAFGWNGDFARKTEESHVSTVIDLLLNLSFFVYFGAIVPWPDFNNSEVGLDVWRLIILAVVIIFLRRIPAVLALKPFTPDIKSWREALFCGHFGPIGVGAIFAAILARADLEKHYTHEETPLRKVPDKSFPHYQLIASIWPIICFVVITSIVVHGSSVAVLTLGKRLNRMAITMSFSVTNTQDQGPSWISRLQKLDKTSTSFSLHRIDTTTVSDKDEQLSRTNTVETSGVKVRPAGGAKRKKRGKRSKKSTKHEEIGLSPTIERQRPQTEFLQLGKTPSRHPLNLDNEDESPGSTTIANSELQTTNETKEIPPEALEEVKKKVSEIQREASGTSQVPTTVYQEGLRVVVEDQDGEIIDSASLIDYDKERPDLGRGDAPDGLDMSIHSMGSLRRHMSAFSVLSDTLNASGTESMTSKLTRTLSSNVRKAFVKKDGKGKGKKYYAHQVDNLLLIENADGEIVRRFRVNKHESLRARSRSIVGRALSLVGIKTRDSATSASGAPSGLTSAVEPSEVKNKLTVPPTVHEDLDRLYGDSESEFETEDDFSETEVEKRRRLAALGEISDGRAESDEEE